MTEFDIYTFGAGFYLEKIFNALRLIIDGRESFVSLMKIACIGAIVMLALKAGINNDLKSSIKWFFGVTVLVGLFLTTRATVHIHDSLPDAYGFTAAPRTVENVPWGLAFLGSITSQVGHSIGDKFSSAFSAVFVNSDYQKTGLLFGSKIIEDVSKIRTLDANLQKFMRDFYKRCIVPDLYMGTKRKNGYTVKDLVNEPNILEFLKNHASRARMIYFSGDMKVINRNGGIFGSKSTITSRTVNDYISCNQGAHYIADMLDYEMEQRIPKLASGFLKYFLPDSNTADKDEIFKSVLQSSYGLFIRQSARDTKDILLQNVMINAIGDSADSINRAYGKVTTDEMTKSMRYTMGQMAQKYVPVFLATLECLFYGVFPLILILMVTPMGLDVLRAYGYGFVYLQLWQPMYAILFCIASAWGKFYASNIDSVTYASSLKVLLINEEISSVAGFMLILVPTLSIFITKGMVASMGNLSNAIYHGPQSAAISNATRAVEGNYQIGTTSIDTHSFNNTSGNKYDDSYSWMSGMATSQLPSGAIMRTTPDGARTLDMSTSVSNAAGLVNVNWNKQMGDRFDRSINDQMSIADRSASSMIESATSGYSKMLGFDNNWSHDSRSYQTWENRLSSEQRDSLDEARSYVTKFAENHGISQQDALRFALTANAKGSLGTNMVVKAASSLGIGADFSTEATKNENFAQMLEAAKDERFAKNLAKIASFTKSDTQSGGDEFRQSMMESVRADFARSTAANMERSKAIENVRSLQENKNAFEQNIGSIEIGLNNTLMKKLVNKEGVEGAASILQNDPEKVRHIAGELLDDYVNEHTNYKITNIQYVRERVGLEVAGKKFTESNYQENLGTIKGREQDNRDLIEKAAPSEFKGKINSEVKAGETKKAELNSNLANTEIGLAVKDHELSKERGRLINKTGEETAKSARGKLKDSWFGPKHEENE